MWLHDNALPYVSSATSAKQAKLKREKLDHYFIARTYRPVILMCSPKNASERAALQLGRQTQGRCEGLGFIKTTEFLGVRNPLGR